MSEPGVLSRQPSHRVFGLDLVRAIAILSVIYVHGHVQFFRPLGIPIPRILGGLDGVDIFFVLSGYLVGGVVIRKFENGRIRLDSLLDFWKFRWFRTLPNYFLILVITLLYCHLYFGYTLGFGPSYLFFLQNLAWPHPAFMDVAWSLAVEEWFYVLFPTMLFLAVRMFPGTSFRACIIMTAVLFLASAVASRLMVVYPYIEGFAFGPEFRSFRQGPNIRKVVLTRLDAIPFGVMGAYASHFHPRFWKALRWPSLLLGVILMVFRDSYDRFTPSLLKVVFFNHYELLIILLAMPLADSWKTANAWLSRPVTFVSIISYSMYLVHSNIVIPLTRALFGKVHTLSDAISSFLFYVAISLIISHLLYRFFEKPMTDLRNRPVRETLKMIMMRIQRIRDTG